VSYLIDTNVLSELVRPKPNKNVLAWFASTPDDALYISTITIGEIRKGIERLPAGARREKLRVWLEHDLRDWFGEHILPISVEVVGEWGRLLAQTRRTVPSIDSLIAATARHHGLRLVSRNVKDFDYAMIDVINPWE
jgi:toxin FitB